MADSRENLAFDSSSVYTTTTLEVADDQETVFYLSCVDGKVLALTRHKNLATAEELSWCACKQQNIEPLAAHLFALRARDGIFLPPGRLLSANQTAGLSFRLRFMCDVAVLAKECPNALAYLFLQCRNDFIAGNIKEFSEDLASAKGLAVIDMLCTMKEEGVTAEEVIKNLKTNYFPRDLSKGSLSNVTQRVKNVLRKTLSTKHMLEILQDRAVKCKNWSIFLLKQQYVDFLVQCAPSYILEQFKPRLGINPNLPVESIRLNASSPAILLERLETADQWKPWCRLQDICDISLMSDKVACQINRLSGPPLYVKFTRMTEVESFVALVDGYHRFSRRFHMNFCRELTNPSLLELKADKCHGPMEKDFIFGKLEGKEDGTYAVSQSIEQYDHYRIDFMQQGLMRSVAVEFEGGLYRLTPSTGKRSGETFTNIQDLLSYYWSQSSRDGLHLRSCVRPSENDAVGLSVFPQSTPPSVTTADGQWEVSATSGPICIPPSALTYLPGYQPIDGQHSTVKRALLKSGLSGDKNKPADVAVRTLKDFFADDSGSTRGDFLRNIQDIAFLSNPSMLTRIHGILLSPLSLVMEYFPLGNMRSFLQLHRKEVSLRTLTDAAAQVIKTIWWMEDEKHPYGPVRAKNVFVSDFSGVAIKVKLGPLALSDVVHWTGSSCPPKEAGLVWSYGTFLWEVFAFGASPLPGISPIETESLYKSGFRLEKPPLCPDEVYAVMERCWAADITQRPKVSELMRDVNKLLVQFYENTAAFAHSESDDPSAFSHETKSAFLLRVTGNCLRHELQNGSGSVATLPYDPWTIDETALKMIERLGEGRYGEVNKAFYTDPLSEDAPRLVAVKQLKQIKSDRNIAFIMEEMRSEMEIMKSLQHENIVEIVGVCVDPVPLLIMEFVENGALNSFLRRHQNSVEVPQLLAFAKDVANGMAYLQSKEIVHRDLAARNILVTTDLRVKISDFGLARFLDTGGYYLTQNFKRDVPLAWYAPEVIEFHKYSSKSDCWSFGVLVWEMFSYAAAPYFCDLKVLAERLRQGQRLGQPAACSDEVYANLPCLTIIPSIFPYINCFNPATIRCKELKINGSGLVGRGNCYRPPQQSTEQARSSN
ncbi:Tyrosine-protein kinase JAK3 [Hypsibius exemplaris]|uniref:non-specific protein-tyrosine kinase n=1 Tax=Hypsibius exemplaris TaxID=2072580 RepID=A0A1W0X2Y3_HYPEX|nr:Tyrosine-protein kinase JAK3 [Hypsibius exemplaris]